MTAAPAPASPAEGPDGPQLNTFQSLVQQRADADAHLTACQAALLGWAGPDVPLSVVTLLQTGELPRAVEGAVQTQQEAERRAARLQQDLEERQARRAQWTAELAALQGRRAAHDHDAAHVKALAALQPAADRLTTVRAQLAQALTRQAGQQGRGLATLWSAVSGQAGALQRAVDQARADEARARLAYEACAQQQGVQPVPDPADVPGQVARAQVRLTAQQQDLERQQHAARTALWSLSDQDEGTRAALRTLHQQAASAWQAAQQAHALPRWDHWVDLWRRREDARPLWARHADAERRLQAAAEALERHLTTFPAPLRDPDTVTRHFGALQAAAARAHAARAEALERTRMLEERQREAARRQAEEQAQQQAARVALLDALHGRRDHLQHAARAQQAHAQATQAQRVALLRVLQGHLASLSADRPHAAAPVRGTPTRAAAAPTALPSPRPPQAAATPSPAPERPISPPVLDRAQLAGAQALLVRHTSAAARAAMCLEALEEWAGTGVDALQLADAVSRPLPAGREGPAGPATSPPAPPADAPVNPETWDRLWAQREKGAALRRTWLDARATMTDVEALMTPLWAGWPRSAQQVSALRLAVETATRAAPPAQPSGPRPPAPAHPAPIQSDPAARTVRHETASADVKPVAAALPAWTAKPVRPPGPVPPGPRPGPWTTPHLTPEQGSAARALLARFDALHEQERQTRAALDRWAGPGLNGPRLAQLVSGPLPGEITQAVDAWARTSAAPASTRPERAQIAAAIQTEKDRSAAVLGPLRQLQLHAGAVIQAEHALAGTRPSAVPRAQDRLQGARDAYAAQAAALGFSPAPSPRRIATLIQDELTAFNRRLQPLDAQWKALVDQAVPTPPAQPGQWTRAWAAVRDRYGLPRHPEAWDRSLWPRRAEGERLWTALQDTRRQRQAAQEDLTVLCATWPAQARTVDVLRQVAGRAGPGARPSPPPPQTFPVPTLPAPTPPARPGPTPAPDVLHVTPPGQAGRPAPTVPPATSRPSAGAPAAGSPAPAQTPPVRPDPVTRPSGPGAAAPRPVLRPVAPLPPAARNAPTGPAAVPLQARGITPPLTPLAFSPPSPVTPPPMPTTAPPRPLAGPGPSHPVVRPAPLRPPVRGVPQPPRPGAWPSAPARPAPRPEPATGRLTRRQRAEREAVRLSDQYDWEQGFHLIADALDRDRWGQLRESIEREIARGMTPDEFELLLHLRAYWHDQTHYQSPYTARYDSLPWGLGIALIRRCAGVPGLDDMILLLERLYEYAQVACSARSLPAFSQRLGAILDRADPDVDLDYWLSAREAR
ncbi:hypothetical protein [Deinococcus radiotolerans]|uniref:Uncharacterized protein n=1 Tax=Deinococcus radiotolerans TaxID=1309407 RepID=A0ABQ2FNC4_9DEIO|nr:hypothetical protein [Deinococcus radiotolerans]GGL10920.1 hypothetical protein GCM10010844_32010 [Deinococcus radiotolerans]